MTREHDLCVQCSIHAPREEVERLREENSELGSHFSWEQDSTIPVCPYERKVERLTAALEGRCPRCGEWFRDAPSVRAALAKE
jgi:hypothetical protein